MNLPTCNECGGSGKFNDNRDCVRCHNKGCLTSKECRYIIDVWLPKQVEIGKLTPLAAAGQAHEMKGLQREAMLAEGAGVVSEHRFAGGYESTLPEQIKEVVDALRNGVTLSHAKKLDYANRIENFSKERG